MLGSEPWPARPCGCVRDAIETEREFKRAEDLYDAQGADGEALEGALRRVEAAANNLIGIMAAELQQLPEPGRTR